jgi:hypothetical protein
MVRPPATTFAEQDKAEAAFAGGGAVPTDWAKWDTEERLRFLNRLPRKLPKSRLDALQSAFDLNGASNMEIRFAWLDLAVANRYDPALPSLEQFLTSQGRGKFVKPRKTPRGASRLPGASTRRRGRFITRWSRAIWINLVWTTASRRCKRSEAIQTGLPRCLRLLAMTCGQQDNDRP